MTDPFRHGPFATGPPGTRPAPSAGRSPNPPPTGDDGTPRRLTPEVTVDDLTLLLAEIRTVARAAG